MAQTPSSFALTNCMLLDQKGYTRANMTLIIRDGVIQDIFTSGDRTLADSIKIYDLPGKIIIPGLIDSHVHMGQLGPMKISPEEALKKWIYSGVTSVRDMGGDARKLGDLEKRRQEDGLPSPSINFSATYGSQDKINKDPRIARITQGVGIENAGWVHAATADLDFQASITQAKAVGVTGIKIYVGVPAVTISRLVEEAHNQGLQAWSHLTVFPDRPLQVVRSGMDVVSHTWGAFWQDKDVDPSIRVPFTHTDARNARAAIFPEDLTLLDPRSPELDSLFREMAARKTLWDVTYATKRPETRALYRDFLLAAREHGVQFCIGTDFHNAIETPYPSLHDTMEWLVSDSILSEAEVLQAVTQFGARALGKENSMGTIEVGKQADLVILDANPLDDISAIRKVIMTIKEGKVYLRDNY